MLIYIVEGSSGEYSDHREWPVKAFVHEEDAKDLVKNATVEANIAFVQYDKYCTNVPNKYDPHMNMTYTGVRYSYFPIELDEGDSVL